MHEYHHMDVILSLPNGHSLFVGDATAAQQVESLKQRGVRAVITAAEGFHIKYDTSMRHYTYSLKDHKTENVTRFLDEAADNIDKCLKYGSVLVHCGAGVSRSATLAIAYLLKYKSMTFREALRLAKARRPQICPNLGFQLQLKAYKQALQDKPQSSKTKDDETLPGIVKRHTFRERNNALTMMHHSAVQPSSSSQLVTSINFQPQSKSSFKSPQFATGSYGARIHVNPFNKQPMPFGAMKKSGRGAQNHPQHLRMQLYNSSNQPTLQEDSQVKGLRQNQLMHELVQFSKSTYGSGSLHRSGPKNEQKYVPLEGEQSFQQARKDTSSVEYLRKMAEFRFGITNTAKWRKA